MGYLYILCTVCLTVYGQLILKWRIARYGALPDTFSDALLFISRLFLDGYILSGFFAAFAASLFWMAAMTKFDVSFAYPFMSAAFALVLFFSVLFFDEPLTFHKLAGLLLIASGIVVTSYSR